MIAAAVIHLQALANGRFRGGSGRAVHGFWFRQWAETVPAVANALHQIQGVMPFTLSPLMDLPPPKKGSTAVRKGSKAWFRVTSLDEALTRPLLESWLDGLPQQIELAGVPWRVSDISLAPKEHPWAGQVDYSTLIDSHLGASGQPRQWMLRFATPAAFRAGRESHLPFPLPDALVASWLRRWQAYAPFPLQWELRPRLREQLLVSAYRLKTVPVRHGRRLIIGCIGSFSLRARALSEDERAMISILADYAFYCGSGHKPTQGMGMTSNRQQAADNNKWETGAE